MSLATRPLARMALCAIGAGVFCTGASAQIDVVTERYDDARLGANIDETTLDTSNVNVNTFGKVWTYTVSGSVYAQPLYVRNVAIPGQGTYNVLYVVTMNDIVYAFDADSGNDAPLLSFDLTSEVAGSTPIPILDILGFNDNIIGNVGIESTPAIDLASNTMYLVARTREMDGACGAPNPTFCQRLHALDITTLTEKAGSPVVLGGSVPGNGSGSSGGTLTFDPKIEDQRASLALSNGRVFIAWSSHSDQLNYHGWVMAYDTATLQQTMIWSAAPDGQPFNGAGIWMAGRAPAVDASGNVYYVTGNGTWDGVTNFGESFVKFGPTPDSPLLDWFTPSAYDQLNNTDADLGGSGPILVPDSDLVVSGGKSGVFYVTHTADMGHESANDIDIVQRFDNSNPPNSSDQIKGGPVYWNRTGGEGWMYVWSDGCNHFNAYRFNGATFDLPPVSQSTVLSPCGSSGGVLTLSANGGTPGSGIVWASIPVSGDANSGVHAGMLRAFDADDLSTELWNSNQNRDRDNAGNWPKFSAPIVVNGRVYLASFPADGIGAGQVNVYASIEQPDFAVTAGPANPGVVPGGSVDYTIDIAARDGFSGTVHFGIDGLPPNAVASFSANDLTPPAQTTLTVQTNAATPPGEFTLSIFASSGPLQHVVQTGIYVTRAAPGAGTIGIDFAGDADLAPVDAAGVVAKPNWNEMHGTSASQVALVDESSADTGATLDFSADGIDALGIADDSPDRIMMDTFLAASGNATTVSVSNLPPDPSGYYVYVYADGNNGALAVTGDYSLLDNGEGSPSTITITDAADATFDQTFSRAQNGAGNYAVFYVRGTGFTLSASPSAGQGAAPINGIQIVHGDRIFADGFD